MVGRRRGAEGVRHGSWQPGTRRLDGLVLRRRAHDVLSAQAGWRAGQVHARPHRPDNGLSRARLCLFGRGDRRRLADRPARLAARQAQGRARRVLSFSFPSADTSVTRRRVHVSGVTFLTCLRGRAATEARCAVTTQTPQSAVLDLGERARRSELGSRVAQRLTDAGVSMVALCWVDNAGITRVKAIPTGRLERAAGWGIGMSPVFDVFVVDDSITTSKHIGGPAGDLRLIPDLERAAPLAAQPGWAWAPVDRYTQEGKPYIACSRAFAKKMVARAAKHGLAAQVTFEIEWAVGTDQAGTFV